MEARAEEEDPAEDEGSRGRKSRELEEEGGASGME